MSGHILDHSFSHPLHPSFMRVDSAENKMLVDGTQNALLLLVYFPGVMRMHIIYSDAQLAGQLRRLTSVNACRHSFFQLLQQVKATVNPFIDIHQYVMRAGFRNAAMVQHHDAVGIADG